MSAQVENSAPNAVWARVGRRAYGIGAAPTPSSPSTRSRNGVSAANISQSSDFTATYLRSVTAAAAPGDAEVDEVGPPGAVAIRLSQQDVGMFDVAVQESAVMGIVQGFSEALLAASASLARGRVGDEESLR
jgi:hypothetical protein